MFGNEHQRVINNLNLWNFTKFLKLKILWFQLSAILKIYILVPWIHFSNISVPAIFSWIDSEFALCLS